jgi:hypothetical protein
LIRVVADHREAIPEYAVAYINSPLGRQYIQAQLIRSIGQVNVNAKKLQAMPIPLPAIPEQRRIVAHLNDVQTQVATLRRTQETTAAENAFVLGGYDVGERDIPRAVSAWRKVKTEMCGRADVELKWKHFFVDTDDPKIDCPLLVKNPHARRNLAALALDHLFHKTPLISSVAVSRKDRATDALLS